MISHGPLIQTDGLAIWYDCASNKSFKGEPTINFWGKRQDGVAGAIDVSASDFSGVMTPKFEAVVNGISDPYYMGNAYAHTNVGITMYANFTKDKDNNDQLTCFFTGKNGVTASYPNPFYVNAFFWGTNGDLTPDITGLSAGDVTISFETTDNSGLYQVGDRMKFYHSGGATLSDSAPQGELLNDGWYRVWSTFAYTGERSVRFSLHIDNTSNRYELDSMSFRKMQVEQKSYPTNFVGTHRNAESGCLFNLMDTGIAQTTLRNTPFNGSGLHKKAGSTANIPMINGYIQCTDENMIHAYGQPDMEDYDEMTIELVFSSDLLGDSFHGLWGRNGTYPFLGTRSNVSYPRMWYVFKDASAQFNDVMSTTEIETGQIYHTALSIKRVGSEEGIIKLYVNGGLEYTYEGSYDFSTDTAGNRLTLMDRAIQNGTKDSKFHMFRYYTKQLTDKQILSNFNATRSRFGL
jgi:hypothetical protein